MPTKNVGTYAPPEDSGGFEIGSKINFPIVNRQSTIANRQ
jgi:hypothetical protein